MVCAILVGVIGRCAAAAAAPRNKDRECTLYDRGASFYYTLTAEKLLLLNECTDLTLDKKDLWALQHALYIKHRSRIEGAEPQKVGFDQVWLR